MRATLTSTLVAAVLALPQISSAEIYELRTYTTNEGKLENLNARFRDHTMKLFEKHGMENVGYWVPTDAEKSRNTLIYVLKHKDRDAARASWKAFLQDPEWRKVAKESQVDGKFLAKRPGSVFMHKAELEHAGFDSNAKDGLFELRIYRYKEGALKDLMGRFNAGTARLFAKHGMGQIGYWHPADEPDSKDTLIYLLRHKDEAAKSASWKAFGEDPEWKNVRAPYGKPLREKPEAILMKATDYSPIQ